MLSDSWNEADHNDTPYVVLGPSGEKLHTVQYQSVRNVTVLRLLTLFYTYFFKARFISNSTRRVAIVPLLFNSRKSDVAAMLL